MTTNDWEKEIHIRYLEKTKTVIINGTELTVLPYGYLSQALREVIKERDLSLIAELEGMRPKIESILWKHYEPDESPNMEEVAKEVSNLIISNLRERIQ